MIDRAFAFSALTFSVAAYVVLEASSPMSMVLEMTADAASGGQVFWCRDGQEFNEGDSVAMWVLRGRGRYQAALPSHYSSLRIDPGSLPGKIIIHRITIATLGIPLMTWDRADGFIGWVPTHGLTNINPVADGLSMMSTSIDPYLVNARSVFPAGRRAALMAFLAIVCSLACAFLHRRLSRAPRAGDRSEAGEPPARRRRLRVATALVASLLALCVGGYFLHLVRRRSAASAGEMYALMLVDRRGRPLSDMRGRVKVELTPFGLYRNAPNQKTDQFATNEMGYRGRTLVGDSRPKVVVLGGSAAFGLGLSSDADALDVQLERLNPGYRFVNAGVAGSVSGQELAEMVHYADVLEPVLYIAMDGANDFFEQFADSQNFSNVGFNQEIFQQLEDQLSSCGASKLTLERWGDILPLPRLGAARKRALVVDGYIANVERMSSYARSRGAAFLVLFQPEMWGDADLSREYREMIDTVAAFSRQRGIPYVDLQSLPQLTQNKSEVFLEGVHLNAKGIRLAAEAADASVKRLLAAVPVK